MKLKGAKDITSAETLMTIDVPGAFDRFLEATSEVQGDNGDTPFRLAYNASDRIVRGRGYSLRLRFSRADADEIVDVLRDYAETCIACNEDLMSDPDTRSEVAAEVAAARRVIGRCDELAAELKARSANNAADASAVQWYAEPRGDGFVVTNGTEFLTRVGTSEPHVYSTQEQAEWFVNAATARAKARELQPTFWLTLLDGKEIRWLSTDQPVYRAVVSIVDPESTKRACLIDHDDIEDPERVVRLTGKPLGYTKFGRWTAKGFKRFAEQYPHYADLVQGIAEGRGITRQVHLNANGNDSEGLWK